MVPAGAIVASVSPVAATASALADQTRRTLVHPVYFGSAVTGTGVPDLESAFDHHAPVSHGTVPERARTDHNPLSCKEYLLNVTGRVSR